MRLKESKEAFQIHRLAKSRRFLGILFVVGMIYGFVSYDLVHKKKQRQGRLEVHLDSTSSNASHLSSFEQNYIMQGNVSWSGELQCPSQGTEIGSSFLRLKNFMEDGEWREEGAFNIFLTETSCSSRPNYRAWCSVESMAHENPEGLVWYVMTSPEVDLQDGLVKQLLGRHKNLRLVTANLSEIFDGTPLQELYHSGAWNSDTKWPAANLSDMLRLAIVWLAGGFYSDTDVICISPLTGLRNVIGLAEYNLVNGANFHFDRHHPMLEYFMVHLNDHFNPYVWGENGPRTVSAVLRDVCKEDVLFQDLECEGVRILSHAAFNPVQPNGRVLLFQRTQEKNIRKRFPYSYAIHFWNRMTHSQPVFKNTDSVYDLAAASFCPISRRAATQNSPYY
ncbi:lactosylceramide 4-alpha-galactosyltransferase-like [Macrobrachium nipponense]|uniref:lactosylceramide 4-alpha-galactosyltransferase-like n=1 Tax=Macrobrachium nipponense TaxID=159736 RepID=UPI0030C7BE19